MSLFERLSTTKSSNISILISSPTFVEFDHNYIFIESVEHMFVETNKEYDPMGVYVLAAQATLYYFFD